MSNSSASGSISIARECLGFRLVLMVVFIPILFKLISPAFILLGLGAYTYIIMPTLLTIGIIISIKYLASNIRVGDVVLYFCFGIIIYISKWIYPLSVDFIDEHYFHFIFQVVPYYFVGLSIKYDSQVKDFQLIARLGIIINIFWQLCLALGLAKVERAEDGSLGEQMGIAYSLLFPLLLTIVSAIEKGMAIDKTLAIIGTMMLFVLGTRGPIIILLTFLAVYLVCVKKYERNSKLKKTLIALAIGISFVLIKPLLGFFMPFASAFGFSTRVFDSFLSNEMLDINNSSYRDEFYLNVWLKTLEDPTGFGYGFGSDRLFTPNGVYTHNLALELLCQFGIIGGSILIILLIFMIVFTFVKIKNYRGRLFSLIMLFCAIGSLQFSQSWITFPLFFVYIGYMVSIIRNNTTTPIPR